MDRNHINASQPADRGDIDRTRHEEQAGNFQQEVFDLLRTNDIARLASALKTDKTFGDCLLWYFEIGVSPFPRAVGHYLSRDYVGLQAKLSLVEHLSRLSQLSDEHSLLCLQIAAAYLGNLAHRTARIPHVPEVLAALVNAGLDPNQPATSRGESLLLILSRSPEGERFVHHFITSP